MPVDLQKLNNEKERIISYIKLKGPSLPVHVAKAVNLSPLFASAYLSELYTERKLFMSHMKIGSSQLYLVPGQEMQLENFIQYLNPKEREALELLKNSKILEDEKQHPAIRVALRAIKDFAIPIRARINEDQKIIWRYFTIPENNIDQLINPKAKEEPKIQEKVEEIIQELKEKTESPIKKELEKITEQPVKEEITEEIKEEKIKKSKPKKTKATDTKFVNNIKEYLSSKDVEILSILEEKPKEFTAKVRIDTLFGKQEYLLLAKNKKKITSEEIAFAHQKAQSEKMPALLMAPGEIDKKSLEHYKDWKNLIKFEKLKL